MSSVEFETKVSPDRGLPVPPDVAAHLLPGQTVRVLVLIEDPDEEEDWKRLTAEQFLKGYSEKDAAYDDLPAG